MMTVNDRKYAVTIRKEGQESRGFKINFSSQTGCFFLSGSFAFGLNLLHMG